MTNDQLGNSVVGHFPSGRRAAYFALAILTAMVAAVVFLGVLGVLVDLCLASLCLLGSAVMDVARMERGTNRMDGGL